MPVNDTGNNAGNDYFIMISASNNPPPGATFQVQIPADGVAMNAGTFPSTAEPSNPNVITIGQGGMMGTPVVISEIQTAGGGGDAANDEFIELYNRTSNQIDLSTWSIQYEDGASGNLSGGSPASSYSISGNIPAYGYFLIVNADGFDGAVAATNAYPASTFSLSATGGTLFLVNSQTPLVNPMDKSVRDKVGWGNGVVSPYAEGTAAPAPPANGSIERKASPESNTTSMTTGIDAGMGNSFDSDSNISDFIVRTTADPQNHTDSESPEMSGSNPVVINEVYYNNTTTDHQWIELYNNAGSPEDISGWNILAGGNIYTVPASTVIGPESYLVVHWNFAGTNNPVNLYTDVSGFAPMSNLAGDVFLTDEGDGAKDYVEYGAGGRPAKLPPAAASGRPETLFPAVSRVIR